MSRAPILILSLSILVSVACRATEAEPGPGAIHYVGSSTIANFLRDAAPAYPGVRFVLDTEPESAGGEAAILEGRADLAGVARRPDEDTLAQGVTATLIGYDAIAVIVPPGNPVRELSRAQLKQVFTGKVRNWSELGGADVPIRPLVVSSGSATRKVFRSDVLGAEDYGSCEVAHPDTSMVARVAADPGAIGQISFSFLEDCTDVRPLAVDGQEPTHTNADYPITRPLYLLWWRGRARVAEFIEWTDTEEARAIFARRFTLAEKVDR